jgi:hypothetical protein
VEIANAAEAVQDSRIHIELINATFLTADGSPDEYRAGIERAITNGWLWRHVSGLYVKFTAAGTELFGLWSQRAGSDALTIATACLIGAAEGRDFMLHAGIGVMRALNRRHVRELNR